MSAAAITMMIVAMLVIWGGLAAAVMNLQRSADLPEPDEIRRDL
ncbi:putative methionine/alanine importer small subunit [Nocardioides albertanoniae]|uniref:Putative methionine/alanine importer small subunit n=1 Tax=Nocardioides albertanoniae TaxID=1175486 RepID=A0A543A2Q3_9ACTN|nr:methionine/alanine import family NSS transporter small subunit [Nocardioides albertanoniae]TQL66862.1 putative methionine/alanine importer small subunit [Nocardioides albertanoniae]